MKNPSCSPVLAGSRPNLQSAVRQWELLRRETVKAITVSGSIWDSMPITGDDFANVGPGTLDLAVHLEMRNRTGTFECRVAIQTKYLDGDWLPAPGNIATADVVIGSVAAIAVDGYARDLFSDRSRLGALQIRLLLQYRAAAGGAVGDQADLSITVVTNPLRG
ncbi:MAG: hypothetical protein Q8P18_04175 [Pseudomonadota bacterium]|nr:hypothetical protein [Pseudomonadota bacterium]